MSPAAPHPAPTMLPDPALLSQFRPTARLTAAGRPVPAWREDLRRIPSARNALAIGSVYLQAVVVVAVAVWLDHPLAWFVALVLMGRTFAQLAALMHEAAHRLLFRTKRWNDWAGRWLLGFPSFTPIDLYRRGHMAHHRQEFGPDEPDLPLYRGYPITIDSFRRKLWRDATGQTGWKLFVGLLRGLRSDDATVRSQARGIVVAQVVLFGIFLAAGHPWLYPLLWFLPFLTAWRVINRLRSIAEHGGLQASPDRRLTTHTVRQHLSARFLLVPYHIGWHLAHHVDAGIPWRRLPELHAELRRSGYVPDGLEYPSYPALWRALSSRPAAERPR